MKNFALPALTAILLFSCIMLNLHAAEQPKYFRFKDESGRSIVSNTLPPEYAQKGYDIVTSRGNVIQHIPPASEISTEKSHAYAQEQEKLKKNQLLEQQATQAKKDKLLLRMFSSIKDIERSRNEKISSIEVLESITRDNIKRQNIQLDAAQKRADLFKKNGTKIPFTLSKHLHETKINIQESTTFLLRKQKEKMQINTQYKTLIKRFERLNIHKDNGENL